MRRIVPSSHCAVSVRPSLSVSERDGGMNDGHVPALEGAAIDTREDKVTKVCSHAVPQNARQWTVVNRHRSAEGLIELLMQSPGLSVRRRLALRTRER